jgi:D-alanyl-lipoteichoic acid acyltransferase DltB (MBOAT superfamily)
MGNKAPSGTMMARRWFPLLLILGGAGIVCASIGIERIHFHTSGGIAVKYLMLSLGGLAAALCGIILMSSPRKRPLGEWLLVGVSVLAAAMAADMGADFLTIHSLAGKDTGGFAGGSFVDMGPKAIMLAMVGIALVLSRLASITSADASSLNDGAALLALCKRNLGKYLVVALQMGLIVLAIHEFHLLNRLFYHTIILLAFFGFLLHSLLPLRYRLPFFVILSLLSLLFVFGSPGGCWLIGIGLLLIGLCHLPIAFAARVALLAASGVLLALLRVDRLHAPWSAAIWPILGSMFMFRLILYMYDLKHTKGPADPTRTLAYFFLLPNVVFPLFPVVDFSAFRRTYYDAKDPYRIYQTGVDWVCRGAVHLILYRYINYYLMLSPREVMNVGDLLRYILANFALYLRVSGQFHICVGLLHLFGFNLPETHHLYYLASSFTDFWRRINIYWKDFMLKVFYYPTYFQLRKWGARSRLVVSTLVVFLATWLLHNYQWFWLRGTFLLSWPDVLFWSILAVLVILNSIWEAEHGRKRTLGASSQTWGEYTWLVLRTAGVFSVICVLWSLWSSASVAEWLAMWSFAGWRGAQVLLWIPAALGVVILVGGWLRNEKAGSAKASVPPFDLRPVATTGAILLILCVLGSPKFVGHLHGKVQQTAYDLQEDRLSSRDAAMMDRGYYENLLGVDKFNSQLWEVYMKRPHNWPSIDTVAANRTNDFLGYELRPLAAVDYRGAPLHTNRWGMRDQDYTQNKPPQTCRIALIGSSHEMGSGVGDGQTFEAVLEDRLNRENDGHKFKKYEILNFAVDGYISLQEMMLLEKKVFDFQPDVLFYVAHLEEQPRAAQYLAAKLREHVPIPYPDLQEFARKAGVDASTPEMVADRRMQPLYDDLTSWVYRRIVADCRQHRVLPVWIYLPPVDDRGGSNGSTDLIHLAQEAGFTVFDLSGVYAGQVRENLRVAEWDWHPNAQGHKLIAERLHTLLIMQAAQVPLGLVTAQAQEPGSVPKAGRTIVPEHARPTARSVAPEHSSAAHNQKT